jgi:hypothetical protein
MNKVIDYDKALTKKELTFIIKELLKPKKYELIFFTNGKDITGYEYRKV